MDRLIDKMQTDVQTNKQTKTQQGNVRIQVKGAIYPQRKKKERKKWMNEL